MPDFYSEPFLHLAGLTHDAVLLAWGGFYFRVKDSGESFKLVDDDDLKNLHPPRSDSIGQGSKTYGKAVVSVRDSAGNVVATEQSDENHVWVEGLSPDTEYTYQVVVHGEEWASGPRRNWEHVNGKMGLGPKTTPYENRFRTHPLPNQPAQLTFAVLGDFGVGVKKQDRPQQLIASALERAVDEHDIRLILTTGDNIYRQGGFLGLGGHTGDEDDDWYFTFYQPYRYVINRVPVYPSVGNHDTDESEEKDDRSQVIDNLYMHSRFARREISGSTPADLGLFYSFQYGSDIELVCLDTSMERKVFDKRLVKHPAQEAFLESTLIDVGGTPHRWQIPFCHHPPFCAGPRHHNTSEMSGVIAACEKAGVRLFLSGHEHQLQHSLHNGVNYMVTGAAGKLRSDKPDKFAPAHTVSWAAEYHFLLVTIQGERMTIRAIGVDDQGSLIDIPRRTPSDDSIGGPIILSLKN